MKTVKYGFNDISSISICDYILHFIFINSVILFSLSSSILLEDFAVENEEVGSDEDSRMELVMILM